MFNYKKLNKIAALDLKKKVSQYQTKISPLRDSNHKASDHINKQTRKAATLVLLYPKKGKYHFVLTQRHPYKGAHGGQISLPGGKLEEFDSTMTECAIRETNEEIGVSIKTNEIIRKMEPIYIPPSNFYVQPYLAIINYEPTFIPEEREVKEIIEVDLTDLSMLNIKTTELADIDHKNIPYYSLNKKIVWGATATILAELHALLDH